LKRPDPAPTETAANGPYHEGGPGKRVDVGAAFAGKCPRCRKGAIFRQLIVFKDKCPECALDLEQFNVGDGATVFLIFLLNVVGMIGILVCHFVLNVPIWINAPLWTAVIIGLAILGLRASKGLLLALEYKNDARIGELKS
jgi:uncharacterized protein (DUF983 family)|tara:strand:- start:15225 stop:15647 length:423 start_codon:yes stop_codon:yes gene_type:complete